MKNLLTRIETYLINRIHEWLNSGVEPHPLDDYRPQRQKDYKTRNERIKWLHRVAETAWSREQRQAAERLAELFARHHGESFSPSTGKILDRNYEQINPQR